MAECPEYRGTGGPVRYRASESRAGRAPRKGKTFFSQGCFVAHAPLAAQPRVQPGPRPRPAPQPVPCARVRCVPSWDDRDQGCRWPAGHVPCTCNERRRSGTARMCARVGRHRRVEGLRGAHTATARRPERMSTACSLQAAAAVGKKATQKGGRRNVECPALEESNATQAGDSPQQTLERSG